MGTVDRLLEALAERLPFDADAESIKATLKAAADALPADKKKTSKRLQGANALEALREKLAAKRPAFLKDLDLEKPVEAEAEKDASQAYEGEAGEEAGACGAHCRKLLIDAMASIQPAKRASEALEGFVAVILSIEEPLAVADLQQFARLVPMAQAALGGKESAEDVPVWRQFLGCVLSSPLRDQKSQDPLLEELASRFGRLVALVASPVTARSALLSAVLAAGLTSSKPLLRRMAMALLPVIHVGFGMGGALNDGVRSRGELAALLHGFCLLGACRAVCKEESFHVSPNLMTEASDSLRWALERHFAPLSLLPELRRLAEAMPLDALPQALRKRLASKKAESAEGAAALTREVLEVASAGSFVTTAALSRLADISGLPVLEEVVVDRRAAAARARGELFFEDVGADAEAPLSDAVQTISANLYEQLPGVDALKKAPKGPMKSVAELVKAKRSISDAAEATPKKRVRKKSKATVS